MKWLLFLGTLIVADFCTTHGQNCTNTSAGFPPINDLGPGYWRGMQGGLYPMGENDRPAGHNNAGLFLANSIQPLDVNGNPDSANGKIVLLAIGMSNTLQEFDFFELLVDTFQNKNPYLQTVNGAQAGQDINQIIDTTGNYWNFIQDTLEALGLSSLQVQIIWFKEAEAEPMNAIDTSFIGYVSGLKEKFRVAMNIMKQEFPRAKLCYIASRIYAGYATTLLNPEPFAYYTGWAVKHLIEDQISGDSTLTYLGPNARSPWLSWGVYLWADGLNPRSDGLTWICPDDYQPDGTHPSQVGRLKVAEMLLDFFASDETCTPWFLNQLPCDSIDLFQARCISGGNVQARIVLLNSTQYAGEEVIVSMDGVNYSLTVGTNGTHSRATMQLTGQSLGDHTAALVSPGGCFNPLVVTCATGLAGAPEEWVRVNDLIEDDAWMEPALEADHNVPSKATLSDNFPNPFNPSTTIRYGLPDKAHVLLEVFNMLGQCVAVLVDQEQEAGWHEVLFEKPGLASGLYFYRLSATNHVQTRKLMLVR